MRCLGLLITHKCNNMLGLDVVLTLALNFGIYVMRAGSLVPPVFYGGGYITYKGRQLGPDDGFQIMNIAMLTACKEVMSNTKTDITTSLNDQGLKFYLADGSQMDDLPLPIPVGRRDKQVKLCQELESKQELIANYATYKGRRLSKEDGFKILDKATLRACKVIVSNPDADFLTLLHSQGVQFHKADGSKAVHLPLPVSELPKDEVEICRNLISITNDVTNGRLVREEL